MSAILMIHGVGSSAEAFVKLAPAFRERGWRVETPTLRPDKRPHENPPPDLCQISLADYVADMEAAARKLEAETGAPPVLLGHSMGGLLVQKLLEKGVGRAGILITPASPAGARRGASPAQAITFANILMVPNPETRAHRIWRFGFSWGVMNGVPRARHAALWKHNLYDSGRVYADLAYPERDPNRTAHVDETKISAPMFIVGAAKDRTTPIADVRMTAAKYARVGANYREYQNNGHWIVDQPGTDRMIADIAAWLEDKGLQPGAPKAKPAPRKAPAKKPAAKATKDPVKAKAAPGKPAAATAAAKPKAAAAKPKAVAKPKATPKTAAPKTATRKAKAPVGKKPA